MVVYLQRVGKVIEYTRRSERLRVNDYDEVGYKGITGSFFDVIASGRLGG